MMPPKARGSGSSDISVDLLTDLNLPQLLRSNLKSHLKPNVVHCAPTEPKQNSGNNAPGRTGQITQYNLSRDAAYEALLAKVCDAIQAIESAGITESVPPTAAELGNIVQTHADNSREQADKKKKTLTARKCAV